MHHPHCEALKWQGHAVGIFLLRIRKETRVVERTNIARGSVISGKHYIIIEYCNINIYYNQPRFSPLKSVCKFSKLFVSFNTGQ